MVCRPARVSETSCKRSIWAIKAGTSSSPRLADLIAQGHQFSIGRPARAPLPCPLPTGFCAAARLFHDPHEESFFLGRDVVDRALQIRVHAGG